MSSAESSSASKRKRRHPPDGGYARGDETRSKIITTALEVFGVHGFGGASTRAIADKAGVTLPALQYYFDSKEGVYLACAEHIAESLEARLGTEASDIARILSHEEAPSRERLFQILFGFLDKFTDLFLADRELENWVLFIIREQAHPTKAFDIIFDRVMRRVVDVCAALVGRLLGLPNNDPEVLVRTFAIVGQIVFFRTAREAALRVTGWPDFEGDHLSLVKSVIHKQIAAALGWLGNTGRQKS